MRLGEKGGGGGGGGVGGECWRVTILTTEPGVSLFMLQLTISHD